jgi:hypothetical protein
MAAVNIDTCMQGAQTQNHLESIGCMSTTTAMHLCRCSHLLKCCTCWRTLACTVSLRSFAYAFLFFRRCSGTSRSMAGCSLAKRHASITACFGLQYRLANDVDSPIDAWAGATCHAQSSSRCR